MKDIRYDLYRLTKKTDTKTFIKMFVTNRTFRKLYYYRNYYARGIKGIVVKLANHSLSKKLSLSIQPTARIGRGVLFLHPSSITINSGAVIGDNLTMLKGATIGNSKTGKVGAPVIGNNVYIGLNSTVVGGITIGNDVMIAANTFVNFDVPDGALVLGSPGVIHKKEKASAEYIANSIFEMED